MRGCGSVEGVVVERFPVAAERHSSAAAGPSEAMNARNGYMPRRLPQGWFGV